MDAMVTKDKLPADQAGTVARPDEAFRTDEVAALRLLMFVRLAISGAVIAYLLLTFPELGGLYWAGLTLLFALLGVPQYLLARARRQPQWRRSVWILLDIAVVTLIILGGNPWLEEDFPLTQRLRYPNFDYMFLIVGVLVLGAAPAAVAWAGFIAIICWGLGVIWAVTDPRYITEYDIPGLKNLPLAKRLELTNSAHVVDISARIQEWFIMLLFAAVLAAGAWRSRRLVRRQIVAERARTQLSRYFSPQIVEEIVSSDAGLNEGRTQDAGVLFADIVGFTSLAEKMPPAAVMELLRQFHHRMGAAVFDHGGTIDKYIGDEIMATFGTPRTGTDDAGDAIRCGQAMLAAVADWNAERARQGEPAIKIGVGIHYGDVVIGDIGDDRRLEFAVIGDTVNVASRLQGLTRDRSVAMLASDEAVRAAGTVTGLAPAGTAEVRGRDAPLTLWSAQAVVSADAE